MKLLLFIFGAIKDISQPSRQESAVTKNASTTGVSMSKTMPRKPGLTTPRYAMIAGMNMSEEYSRLRRYTLTSLEASTVRGFTGIEKSISLSLAT